MNAKPCIIHPLYQAALDADSAYSKACTDAGYRDRWHRPQLWDCPASVQSAYHTKVAADAAWLDYMRAGKTY